jgi:hypothetical protein
MLHNISDRRLRQRFRIEQDICYKCPSGRQTGGVGKVMDISSKGIRFTTEGTLSPGMRIELSVGWPARLNNTCLLKLMIYGSVVRSEMSATAVRIERYEFRTRAIRTLPLSPNTLSYPKEI